MEVLEGLKSFGRADVRERQKSEKDRSPIKTKKSYKKTEVRRRPKV
jgi:hypothetical protein